MSNAGQHLQPGISKRRDELTATFLDVRDVEITAQNVHPHCDLFESAPGGGGLNDAAMSLRCQRDGIHCQKKLTRRPFYAVLIRQCSI